MFHTGINFYALGACVTKSQNPSLHLCDIVYLCSPIIVSQRGTGAQLVRGMSPLRKNQWSPFVCFLIGVLHCIKAFYKCRHNWSKRFQWRKKKKNSVLWSESVSIRGNNIRRMPVREKVMVPKIDIKQNHNKPMETTKSSQNAIKSFSPHPPSKWRCVHL